MQTLRASTMNLGVRVGALPRSERHGRAAAGDASSGLLASVLIATTDILLMMFSSDRLQHWFLIPVSVCGVLMATDGLEWVRGRLDLYDPVGILGIVGFHFFFLAPLLHVKWDFWMGYVSPPPDWRDWLGYMAILNAVGLICYRLCCRAFNKSSSASTCRIFWQIDRKTFSAFAPFCLAVAVIMQVWVYARLGGISGYMQARLDDPTVFTGMGWIFMISESAPILLAFLVLVRVQQQMISWFRIAMALIALFVMGMVFGGLRGSRSETVELLFWVVGCIHFLVRPIPRKLIYCGCVFLILFMYFYGFYKDVGIDATAAFSGSQERDYLAQKTGRTFEGLVLGDLSRADLQAFILYRLVNDGRDFSYAKGRTYVGALSLLVPRWILPERPETKLKEGTEIQAGRGEYVPNLFWSSKVYGLAGESMLNFGPPSVLFVYAFFGLLVGWLRGAVARLLPGDARFLLVPFGVYMGMSALAGDSDNLTFGLAKNGFLPLLVVIVCSAKLRHFVVIRVGESLGPPSALLRDVTR
jgi:hypothetical protein